MTITNEKVYEAMIKWIDEMGVNAKKIERTNDWLSADDWGRELNMVITPQRLTAMYKKGLVHRHKDKAYYGDNNYRYWPVIK